MSSMRKQRSKEAHDDRLDSSMKPKRITHKKLL